jgi:hypothetical protein
MKIPTSYPPMPAMFSKEMLEMFEGTQLELLIVQYGLDQVRDRLEGVKPSEDQM